jgi:predicted ATPase/class 3 adenylate cyclase
MTGQPVTPFPFGDLPGGTVTFLFSDIEGSTELLYRLGHEFTSVLAEHHRILREAVAHAGGQVVRTEGDSFFVAFPRATGAVAAAVEAQRALAQYPWPEGAAVRVRMGLHTGEPEVALDDYVGIAIHRAARIAHVGHGGQVLLSETTTALVQDDLPSGVSLLDLGCHLLKDIRRPERICQLAIEGLPSEFPPLKTLGTLPPKGGRVGTVTPPIGAPGQSGVVHNLPAQLSRFVGRERAIAETAALLSTARLVTLVGPGGIGKTRLALQVAAHVLTSFIDGVWLVELAPLTNPDLMLQSVASTLGLREIPGVPLLRLITDYLRGKQVLLLLDNCEHLVEACARLADQLLHSSPHLHIMATSREALGVAGEVVYGVPPLTMPEAQGYSLERLSQYEGIELFVDRALVAEASFLFTEENAPAIAHICRHLDGIPLAIELAASRIRLFTPEQIAERLDHRFRLLTGGGRTATRRQQTLRALIDWSYDLLSDLEQAMFRRLSVFVGGWSFEAAEAVCSDFDVLDLLAALVNKSLVVVEHRGNENRYGFLETMRQYAREKLDEAG